MQPKSLASWLEELGWILAAPLLALLLTVLVTLPSGAQPLTTLEVLIMGGLGSMSKFGQVLSVFVPLLFCSAGLLIPFTARLWNIGIEGQVILGAIFCTCALMPVTEGGPAHIALALGAGMALPEASILANYAAGYVVGQVGTATVGPRELREALTTLRQPDVERWLEIQ